jgi:aspartate/methionine/tyrosine aminotransferase
MQVQTAARLDGIGEYYFSRKLREIEVLNQQGKQVINLGIGSPDLPPHPDVIRVLQEAAVRPDVHAYQSYKGSPVLREAVADWYQRWYGVQLDANTEILPLIGSKEGIMHICMTYLQAGDMALIPDPGYPTYSSAVQLSGATPLTYQLTAANNWMPDFEALEAMDLSKVKLMWVNYPHMPTGQLPTPALFERLVAFGKAHGMLICHDNPYSFILNDHPVSLLAVPGAKEVVLELNSLSKSSNMAGWRVGTLCAARERIEEVLRFKSNMDSGMLLPVQLAAAKALQLDASWYTELNAVYRERREAVYALLRLLNCRFSTEQAGLFVWAAVPETHADGYALSDQVLGQASVFLTPGGIFGEAGNGYIRISLCASTAKLQEAMQRIQERMTIQ